MTEREQFADRAYAAMRPLDGDRSEVDLRQSIETMMADMERRAQGSVDWSQATLNPLDGTRLWDNS